MEKDIKDERRDKRVKCSTVKLCTKFVVKQSSKPLPGTACKLEDSSIATVDTRGNANDLESAAENSMIQCQDEIQNDVNLAECTSEIDDCFDKNTKLPIKRNGPSSLPYPQLSKSCYRNVSINNPVKYVVTSSPEKIEDCDDTLNDTETSTNKMKRKYKQEMGGRQKNQKTNKQCDKPSSLPFPNLSCKWYALQTAKEKLCFPKLSQKWFQRQNLHLGHEQMPEEAPKTDQSCYTSSSCSNLQSDVGSKQATIENGVNNTPFKYLSKKWYRRRGVLSLKNCSRKKQLVACGTISQNIQELKDMNKNLVTGTRKHDENSTMVKVGNYILENGPLVPTQEIGKFLVGTQKNGSQKKRRYRSCEILQRVQRHLNVIQIQIRGKAYLMENRNQDISQIASRLEGIVGRCSQEDLNAHLETSIGPLLKKSIRFADTKKDVDLIKGLFASATSVKFVAKILDVQNRNSIRSAI